MVEMEMSEEEKRIQNEKVKLATMLKEQNDVVIRQNNMVIEQNQKIINLLIDLKHCTCKEV